MNDSLKIKDDYILARCCQPDPPDAIVGYYSHKSLLKVHKAGCVRLRLTDQSRLVQLDWADIVAPIEILTEEDRPQLEEDDLAILSHFRSYGIDYAAVIGRETGIGKSEAFRRCLNLRELGLIARVEAKMVQYRKGFTSRKWIKHRNHTYYELTNKGRRILDRFGFR